MSKSTYRLPLHASPRRYDIQLDARLGREEFTGRVAISLDMHEAKDTLDLHAKNLVVTNAELRVNDVVLSAAVTPDPDNERIVLQFAQAVPVGEAMLTLDFNGKVSQTLTGLYLAQDKPEQVLCTQCEATEARAIFPCFDEPAFKAQFAFEITTTPDATVLSNGPLLSVKDNDTTKTWTFAPTKRMSSYLVALVIGDVAGTPEKMVNGIPLRVWSMRGKEQFGAFALDYTARLLPWYEDYFGVAYHYDKYDQVGVPGFAAGAMENSGLVLFRQELLIMAPESSSLAQEKTIAHVIAHEFAHMWFGNLVTMQWWDDLWLNEAFAEWMAHRVIDELSPEYRLWDRFAGDQAYALSADALESTHPIYSPVNTPAQAQELFDAITYLKGCAVLRMLENFLGREDFRNGLRTYMQEFHERNAAGSDLWRHLQAASQQPVTEIMESWIGQAGHPCVSVRLETIDGQQQLHLSQKRFFTNPQPPQDNDQSWRIPLVIRYADDETIHVIHHVLAEPTGTLSLNVTGELHWCYLNAGQVGFYRQKIEGTLLDRMLAHLDQLTPSEQMGLLADQWALTRNGQQPIGQFLEVVSALAVQSSDYNLLLEVVYQLKTLEQMVEAIEDPTVLDEFREWVRGLFQQHMQIVGFEAQAGESSDVAQQRIPVIDAMTSLGHDPQAISQAQLLADREMQDPQSIDPNLANPIIAIIAQFGDAELFQKHINIYEARKASSAPPQTVQRYLYSFPAFRAPELVNQTLSLLDEGIAPREALGPFLSRMLSARHSQLAAWEYFKNNWSMIKELGMGASGLLKGAGNLPYSMRDDLVSFCEANVKGVADMGYAQALETMDLQAEFRARTRGELMAWFNDPKHLIPRGSDPAGVLN